MRYGISWNICRWYTVMGHSYWTNYTYIKCSFLCMRSVKPFMSQGTLKTLLFFVSNCVWFSIFHWTWCFVVVYQCEDSTDHLHIKTLCVGFLNVFEHHIPYNLFILFIYLLIFSLLGYVVGILMHGIFNCLISNYIFINFRVEKVLVYVCVYMTCSTA